MREILFRGKGDKRYNDGDWYYGLLTQYTDGDYQICIDGKVFKTVDPDTVCQYTGLTDKNEKKIFEGDIVKCTNGIKTIIGIVQYGTGCFNIKDITSDNSPAIDIVFNEYDVEVIGNKFDNPELLEKEK